MASKYDVAGFDPKWEIRDGIVFLDGIWIAPANLIRTEQLEEAADYARMGA